MPSFGMSRRWALVRTDVLEDRITSIIRVTRIVELGTMLAVNSISSQSASVASGRRNRSNRGKSTPVSLCQPYTPQ
jgi:hypothetical protein